ncbi:MAG: cytochrome c1 [Gammaproteobacteria bacterium]|jgi:ubiquinol-cytochrome c reductase cytochrome c1 subunit
MKKLVFTVLIIAFSNFANSAKQEDGLVNDFKAVNNINNKSSLQRGAKYFVNYCSGCHSLKYMRMSTLANDLDIDEETFLKNLMFSDKKIGETMTIAMKESDALLWFNAVPPDLSLTARSKGADYIYAKLNTYYEDDSAITGYNNLALPNSSMPNILAGLQGGQKIILDSQNKPVSLEKISEGKYSEEEYKQLTNDITNFLVYVSEPAKLKRFSMGFWVLLFIFIFTIIAYYTKKEFWKDVH